MDLHPEELLDRGAAGELTAARKRATRGASAPLPRVPAGATGAQGLSADVPPRGFRGPGPHRGGASARAIARDASDRAFPLRSLSIRARGGGSRRAHRSGCGGGLRAGVNDSRESEPRLPRGWARRTRGPRVARAFVPGRDFHRPPLSTRLRGTHPLARPGPIPPPFPGRRRPRRAALAKTATETRSPRAAADDAAGLFGEANASRRRGEHERAATAYERLIAGYPQSAEARESLESLGRMRLDDGDGAGALQCFDAYLRRGGALIAEAMVGRALALEQLGRIDQERDAWRALVDAFPDSVHADRARTRLAKLGR